MSFLVSLLFIFAVQGGRNRRSLQVQNNGFFSGKGLCNTQFFCGGKSTGDCFCDALCYQMGDCCIDVETTCGISPPNNPQGCKGHCGDKNQAESCWCDDLCTFYGDCCTNYNAVCDNRRELQRIVEAEGKIPSPPNTDEFIGCKGHCGETSPDGCLCDDQCELFDDCCSNYESECGNARRTLQYGFVDGLCEDHCGLKTPSGCWCDANCNAFNNCCADVEEYCAAYLYPGKSPPGYPAVSTPASPAVPTPASPWWLFSIAPPTGLCSANDCGFQSPSGCYCDGYCSQYNDCCANVASVCPHVTSANSGCVAHECGGQSSGGCWCDALCTSYGDCCTNFASVCAHLSG